MIVWAGVFKDSTYGSFQMAMVGYETYHGDDQHWEYHWFTDNLRAGEVYGYVAKKAYPSWDGMPIYFEYDVTLARINIDASEHQLNATIIVKGKTLFTAEFVADTTTPIQSAIEPSQVSHELYLSVDARQPLLSAKVTGLEAGAFDGGVFVHMDTELVDSSLLPRAHNARGKVGLILATGGLGDKSFNDISYAGVQKAKDELRIDFDYVEPTAVAQYEGYQRAFAATGDYDIIICVGWDQADALSRVAAEYPGQKFAIIDNVVDKPNVASLLFKQNEGSFLVGVIAGMKTHSAKVGFVGGMDISLIRDFFVGYEAGAKWANSMVEVVPPVFVGGWADPTKGKELALGLADLGVDVIYAAAGKSGLGVLEAVHERGIIGLGVDACQCYLYPEVIASMTKRIDVGAFDMIEATIEETFQGGIKNGGLKEGWVGCCRLPEEEDFWEEKFLFTHPFLEPSVIDKMVEARDKIVAGEITVPSAF